eukprot:4806171-Pyramimonas_sp.AAC.1
MAVLRAPTGGHGRSAGPPGDALTAMRNIIGEEACTTAPGPQQDAIANLRDWTAIGSLRNATAAPGKLTRRAWACDRIPAGCSNSHSE